MHRQNNARTVVHPVEPHNTAFHGTYFWFPLLPINKETESWDLHLYVAIFVAFSVMCIEWFLQHTRLRWLMLRLGQNQNLRKKPILKLPRIPIHPFCNRWQRAIMTAKKHSRLWTSPLPFPKNRGNSSRIWHIPSYTVPVIPPVPQVGGPRVGDQKLCYAIQWNFWIIHEENRWMNDDLLCMPEKWWLIILSLLSITMQIIQPILNIVTNDKSWRHTK